MAYQGDLKGRVKVWQTAIAESGRLADEWAEWLHRPDPGVIQPL
jgi:hypothetical protein